MKGRMTDQVLCGGKGMANWICEQCGKGFKRHGMGARPIRFCTRTCYQTWRGENRITGGQFQKAHVPWNKGLTGIRQNPATEFKKGHRPPTWKPVGTITTRKRYGRERAWVKVAEPNIWKPRAYVVWEEAGGPELPLGYFLHYLDGDSLNDDKLNLAAVTRSFHLHLLRKHHPAFEEKRRRAARKARWGW